MRQKNLQLNCCWVSLLDVLAVYKQMIRRVKFEVESRVEEHMHIDNQFLFCFKRTLKNWRYFPQIKLTSSSVSANRLPLLPFL